MQEFKNNRITLRFDETRCCHAGECVLGLPAVFDPSKDPWIDVNAASVEEIAEVVRRCPSGALSCEPAQ
jgi:uncharacterized Fe-S cluster protein YjdI